MQVYCVGLLCKFVPDKTELPVNRAIGAPILKLTANDRQVHTDEDLGNCWATVWQLSGNGWVTVKYFPRLRLHPSLTRGLERLPLSPLHDVTPVPQGDIPA